MQEYGGKAIPLAGELSLQRKKHRADFFNSADKGQTRIARISGKYMRGRNDQGRYTESRTPESFGIKIDGCQVRISFSREDAKKLKAQSQQEIEKEARKGAIPRIKITVTEHIITAVRTLKHIREGQIAEMKETAEMLEKMDTLNANLANGAHTDAELESAILFLEDCLKNTISKKDAAVKHLGAEKLQGAVDILKKAKEQPIRSRAFKVGTACVIFTAARARLGEWRDRDLAGLATYNRMREASLRVKRDDWLLSQLARFSDATNEVFLSMQQGSQSPEAIAHSPRFILEELKNKEDPYMVRVTMPLEIAVIYLESGDIARAKPQFKNAESQLLSVLS